MVRIYSEEEVQIRDIPLLMHFPLAGFWESHLESACVLVLNLGLGTLSQLSVGQDGAPKLLQVQQFSVREMSVLLPLLQACPAFCFYDRLLASFEKAGKGYPTQEEISRCGERLRNAHPSCTSSAEDTLEEIMRPVHRAIARARLKVRVLGLEISSLPEVGYLLRQESSRMVSQPVFSTLRRSFVEM